MTVMAKCRVSSVRDVSALPAPILANWDWQMRAACRGLSTDLFFKSDAEPRSRKHSREAEAKAVCAVCPVVAQCLNWAFSVGEHHGVWGGMSADERAERWTRRRAEANDRARRTG